MAIWNDILDIIFQIMKICHMNNRQEKCFTSILSILKVFCSLGNRPYLIYIFIPGPFRNYLSQAWAPQCKATSQGYKTWLTGCPDQVMNTNSFILNMMSVHWSHMSMKTAQITGILAACSTGLQRRNINCLHYCPFVKEIHQSPVDSPPKGKCFHVTTSSDH